MLCFNNSNSRNRGLVCVCVCVCERERESYKVFDFKKRIVEKGVE